MWEQFQRTAMLLGAEGMERLAASRVAVFGIGGVGGHCAEALARSGVGAIDLYDDDRVCLSNLNRQAVALHSTLGRYKVDVMRERVLDINPAARVRAERLFYGPETADGVNLAACDYVVDAIDTVTAKLELICRCAACGTPVISSMGAANKLDPTAFEAADIYATSGCPLARVMRRELRKRGIASLRVVYSREEARAPLADAARPEPDAAHPKRQTPGSVAFVPPVAGLILAGEVIRALAGGQTHMKI